MPPSPVEPVSTPQVCSRPSAQPLRTSGKVSQLGTLSFQPSTTAEAIMATQTKASGQWVTIACMRGILVRGGVPVCSPLSPRGRGVGGEGRASPLAPYPSPRGEKGRKGEEPRYPWGTAAHREPVGPCGPGGQTRPGVQLPVPPMVLLTLVKVLLALLPRAVMAAMHTTIMRASMTAYSTAVGPLSSFRNFTSALPSF